MAPDFRRVLASGAARLLRGANQRSSRRFASRSGHHPSAAGIRGQAAVSGRSRGNSSRNSALTSAYLGTVRCPTGIFMTLAPCSRPDSRLEELVNTSGTGLDRAGLPRLSRTRSSRRAVNDGTGWMRRWLLQPPVCSATLLAGVRRQPLSAEGGRLIGS